MRHGKVAHIDILAANARASGRDLWFYWSL
jgi:hypothetical protein